MSMSTCALAVMPSVSKSKIVTRLPFSGGSMLKEMCFQDSLEHH